MSKPTPLRANGGKARAAKLSSERRSEIGAAAARARWSRRCEHGALVRDCTICSPSSEKPAQHCPGCRCFESEQA